MYATNDINSASTSTVVQMLTQEEERLVDLFAQVIISTTLKELHEKRNTLFKVQQQGTEPQQH
jgi:hypothetical protein